MNQTSYMLRAGTLAAEIRPAYGGRITRFYREEAGANQEFFRPTPAAPGDVHAPFKTGCYPLTPFSNRIDHGRFVFQGKTVQLPSHPRAAPHAMHGHGSVSIWEVTAQADAQIRIAYRYQPESWPFAYEAAQEINLDAAGLSVAIYVTNQSAETMPVGLGLHPFFDYEPGTILRFTARRHWLASADFLPYSHVEVPPELDFSSGRDVGGNERNHSFDDWDGRALIRWPDRPEALEILVDTTLSHLILHRPPSLPYFCLEPVSHVTNAFNLAPAGHADTGFRDNAT